MAPDSHRTQMAARTAQAAGGMAGLGPWPGGEIRFAP
jgi:hypothetical protein